MIEHGHPIEDDLEQDYRDDRRPDYHDGGGLDEHREDDLYRVEARPRGQVIIEIRVMHPVQPPQRRDGMHHDVLQPDHKIHAR